MSSSTAWQLLSLALPALVGANMNAGLTYTISNPAPGHQSVSPPFVGEYFEVDSPTLRMQYSQVYWQTLPPAELPADIVSRFANKTMAVTGFEVDLLRQNNLTGQEESVPAYQSYNHHYSPNLVSAAVQLKLDANGQATGVDRGHGKILEFELRNKSDPPPPNARLNQAFVHGNGQEHRQMYHGAPTGYVQPIYSPSHFVLTPMQVATNDGTNATGPSGPLPKFSRETVPPNTLYSPLLECPCTDRVPRKLGHASSRIEGRCAIALLQSDCFAAAAASVGYQSIASNSTVHNPTLPPGCSVSRSQAGSRSFEVVFNTDASSTVSCDGGSPSAATLEGSLADLVGVGMELNSETVTLSLAGPAGVWFGVGFNGSSMADLPYTIIVDGNGRVSERRLGNHLAGRVLAPSVTVVNNSISGGVRRVVLSRAARGASPDHMSFSNSVGSINMINAVGNTVDLQQHDKRGAVVLNLFRVDTESSCLCTDGGGSINGIPYNADCKPEPLSDLLSNNNPTCQVSSYVGGLACCVNGGFLLDQEQQVPEFVDEIFFRFRFYFEEYDSKRHVDINHVEWANNGCDSGCGGPNVHGCHHIEFDVVKGVGSHLGPDVQMFQSDFKAGWMLASECSMSSGQCFDGRQVTEEGIKLIMAASHCHAPNCLGQQLINVDSGEMLCNGTPILGNSELVFHEEGYLYTPPCLWGEDEGLLPPPVLHRNTSLKMITLFNSTWGHPGQMGIWQMKAALA